jgi:hypothetical protein
MRNARKDPAKLGDELIVRKGAAAPADPMAPISEKPVAVTLRLDQARYERLRAFGARHRLKNQAVLVAALDRYLDAEERGEVRGLLTITRNAD